MHDDAAITDQHRLDTVELQFTITRAEEFYAAVQYYRKIIERQLP